MTITPTKILDSTSVTNANNVAFAFTGTAAVGDKLVAFLNAPGSSAATGATFTDSVGNVWTVRGTMFTSAAAGRAIAVADCRVSVAITTSVNIIPALSPTGNNSSNWIIKVFNLGRVGTFDVSVAADFTSTTLSPTIAETAASREDHQFVMAVFDFTNTTHSPFVVGSGYTLDPVTTNGTGTSQRNLVVEWAEVNAPGTRSAGGSFTTNAGAYSAIILSWAADAPSAVMDAGADQSAIEPGATVTLDSSASTGVTAGRAWTQTAGPTVALSSTTATGPTFIAPPVLTDTTLTFKVTDSFSGTFDTVNVAVLRSSRRVKIGGVMVPTYRVVTL